MDPLWHDKHFDELSTLQLYALIRLREQVFVVEQDCVYLDCDGLDLGARHVFATTDDERGELIGCARVLAPTDDERGELIGCARVLAPGVAGEQPAIGRVVTAPAFRGRQLGRALMERAIASCERAHGELPIRVSAQSHLEIFYRSLGFEPTGKAYLEDGIPHIEMIRPVG